LGDQAVLAVRLLEAGPAQEDAIGLDDHYARAALGSEDLEGETNVAIREGSDEQARDGQGGLQGRVEAAVDRFPGLMWTVPAHTPTLATWQGWAPPAPDLLTTRLMKLVVPSPDLAASVGVETPEFP